MLHSGCESPSCWSSGSLTRFLFPCSPAVNAFKAPRCHCRSSAYTFAYGTDTATRYRDSFSEVLISAQMAAPLCHIILATMNLNVRRASTLRRFSPAQRSHWHRPLVLRRSCWLLQWRRCAGGPLRSSPGSMALSGKAPCQSILSFFAG